MLVLTRRVGQALVIDGNIRLTIVSIRGQRVRLGIAAPPAVAVEREELHQRRSQIADRCPTAKVNPT